MASETLSRASEIIINNILTRRSVRAYASETVSEGDIDTMMECAMSAPSAVNEQPWDFVVIDDPDILGKVGSINKYAAFAASAPLGILVCMNNDKVREREMAILDMGMASENIMLAAHALGLGTVFAGIYPYEDRIKGFRDLCRLPNSIVPMGLIIIGHPRSASERTAPDRFKRDNIHKNTWSGE